MADLLIHSMSEFADIIVPALEVAGAREIVEIGAEFGGMSQVLADIADAHGGRLTSIDPAPKKEFLDWVATRPGVRHVATLSLDAIDGQRDVDAWIVDGDHNWYTVYNELKQIRACSRRDGKPMLVFLHDVAWPCARRDLYYAPDQIPADFRHPHDWDSGMVPGFAGLVPGRGFRGCGQFAAALHEGGPKNGVMTAIDDFLAEALAEGEEYAFAEVPAVFGLGVLFAMDAPWSQAVAEIVLPYHDNALIRRLEENRLANYLTVVDIQDGFGDWSQAARAGDR
ncbi:class I SAM-dependent methyltransferase [Sphingosinicella sp. YJ22]|uniref:class I SAM-dependent methyltransferase n=1 Tax=Sphingosinicella sp. YJ22 TaxID=1104780 RepID=UPI00140D4CB5|nr:class I SAM-dependent methyltransferase [Sphingosinicella sp. YJ22]